MPEICPFLAATHDLDSVLSYPTEGNVCTRLGEAMPVATGHQAGYCLRARYWFCPVYTGAIKQPPTPIAFDEPLSTDTPRATPIPVPEVTPEPDGTAAIKPETFRSQLASRIAARAERNRRAPLVRPREALTVLAILAAVGLGGSYLSGQLHNQLGALPTEQTPLPTVANTLQPATTPLLILHSTNTIAPSATVTISDSPTATLSITPTISATATVTITASASPRATDTPGTPKACVAPPDWISYTIQPGETYYHIATKFGTTVEILQQVNCLADPQRVLSGQTLSVPPVPTSTPTPNHNSAR